MKRGLLLLLGMFMMVSTVEANNGKRLLNRIGFDYSYENSVSFIERGVEFFIFTNGEFDFNTNYNNTFYDYNGRRTRRNIGVSIDRDFRGRIRRVGNAFINYDRRGNVTRIGNVFMRYYRGRLTNVGNLRVRYDRWGYPVFYGNVKNNFYTYNGIRFNLNIGDVCDYNDRYFFGNDFRRNYSQIREDNNFYYYRANPNAKIGKRSQILRRRKPASVTKKRVIRDTRNSNNSYRKSSNSNVKNARKVIREKKKNDTNRYRKSTVKTEDKASKKEIIEKRRKRKK